MQQSPGESRAEQPAASCQDQCFGQQLPPHAPPRRAQRGAQRRFAGPLHRAVENKPGHIRANDQQHGEHCCQEQEQRSARAVTDLLARRLDPDRVLVVNLVVARGEGGLNRAKLRFGLRRCHAGTEASDDFGQRIAPDLRSRRGALHEVRDAGQNLGRLFARLDKSPGHDADDDVRLVADADGPAEYMRIAAEHPLPEPIAHDCDALSGLLVLLGESAAQCRLHAEHSEVVCRDTVHGDHRTAAAIVAANEPRIRNNASQPGKGVVVGLPVEKVGPGSPARPDLACRTTAGGEHSHQLLRVRERKWAQEHGIDEAVDSGGHADPEGQGCDHGDGETRRPPQLAQGNDPIALK